MAAPLGGADYINIARTRYLIQRGTVHQAILPNEYRTLQPALLRAAGSPAHPPLGGAVLSRASIRTGNSTDEPRSWPRRSMRSSRASQALIAICWVGCSTVVRPG